MPCLPSPAAASGDCLLPWSPEPAVHSVNERVLRHLSESLEAGHKGWLCTILETWGSSPRPAGSLLAVDDRGRWAGSVSGGCLEEQLIESARAQGLADRPEQIDYGISEADQGRFRLPCGGRIRLLVEPFSGEAAREHLAGLLEALANHRRISRRVHLENGERELVAAPLVESVQLDGDQLVHTLGPGTRLLLVGAGEVARHLGRMALAADFSVTLCEPREAFLRGWDEPGIAVEQRLPDDLVRERFNDRHAAILALAHDPRVDDMALLAALTSKAFYVGAMGSQRTSAQRRQRLYELGLDRNAISRLHAPVGLSIGSKTPAEIAVSILAELVAERYRLLTRALNL